MINSTTQTIDAVVTVRLQPTKKDLRDLVGTLTHDEAKEQQKLIDEEFEKIEGF